MKLPIALRLTIVLVLISGLALPASSQSRRGCKAAFTPLYGSTLSFGSVPVGHKSLKTFYFENTGRDTLFIQSLDAPSDTAFTIQFASLTIAPKAKGKVIVQFAPNMKTSNNSAISFAVADAIVAPTLRLTGNSIRSNPSAATADELIDTSALAAKQIGGAH